MAGISVIMGVYNLMNIKNLADTAISSILEQTYQDFEFLICDDGSIDDTWEYLKRWERKDRRIHLFRHDKNRGLAAALNTCLKASSDAYIARQDADDISNPTRLEKQLAFLEKNKEVAFAGSNVALYNSNGIWGRREFPEYPGKEDFLFSMPFVHGALMMRREALLSVNGYRVEKETRCTEDYDLLMRLYSRNLYGANLQEILYNYFEDDYPSRRKYRYYADEAVIRWRGFSAMRLMPRGFFYVLKPLIVGLIPVKLLFWLKEKHKCYIRIEEGKENK